MRKSRWVRLLHKCLKCHTFVHVPTSSFLVDRPPDGSSHPAGLVSSYPLGAPYPTTTRLSGAVRPLETEVQHNVYGNPEGDARLVCHVSTLSGHEVFLHERVLRGQETSHERSVTLNCTAPDVPHRNCTAPDVPHRNVLYRTVTVTHRMYRTVTITHRMYRTGLH